MNSMTGYGRSSMACGVQTLVVELVSVNRKNLEVFVNGPKDWFPLERLVMEQAKARFQRGRINVALKLESSTTADENALADPEAIAMKLGSFRKICEASGIPYEPDQELLTNLIRLNALDSNAPPWETVDTEVTEAVSKAFDDFAKMRAQEGQALYTDLVQRLDVIEGLTTQIQSKAPEVGPAYKEQLLERLKNAELDLDPSDERILKEISLFVDRSDISEELTRLSSHFVQLRDTMGKEGAIGRKIDFILQEIFREFNTIGSKANHIDISQAVITAKNELERFREQAQNIE